MPGKDCTMVIDGGGIVGCWVGRRRRVAVEVRAGGTSKRIGLCMSIRIGLSSKRIGL